MRRQEVVQYRLVRMWKIMWTRELRWASLAASEVPGRGKVMDL